MFQRGARFGLSGDEEGTGIQMVDTAADRRRTHSIECPVCQAHGALLRHDIRGSLVYFCQRCQHEWQIDPAEEPLEVDLTVSPGPLRGET